ncbi:MAG: tRNA (guanosine(46)-N7)-methyltransferase TrmB [Clostridia bacterium]|jgi:tRNA (guanine-N7-)-methyltransferase|nr:tRNA (guanosine(46)-N7)-methyltransferase TrmB [Clostridia bacterium]MCI9274656.1 tRNA (guanosine(46)-N7)-methyltransferase TrmB [Clostridia bacterium]
MRIRYKKWARPELEACSFYIDNPEENKGKWHSIFRNKGLLYIELGCGKGAFISKLAVSNPEINFIGVDLVDAMLGLSKRNIEKVYKEAKKDTDNVIITRHDIERISLFMSKEDVVDRIYINFCNPWPKPKHRKKRLTHTKQLKLYREFLRNGGDIYFKTDDDGLFTDSLKYFEEAGFDIINKTYDLHNQNIFEDNIETEHEKMFTEEGKTIKALIARKKEEE